MNIRKYYTNILLLLNIIILITSKKYIISMDNTEDYESIKNSLLNLQSNNDFNLGITNIETLDYLSVICIDIKDNNISIEDIKKIITLHTHCNRFNIEEDSEIKLID